MKRICSALLAFILCVSLADPTFAAEGESVQVSEYYGRIMIDGARVHCQLNEKEDKGILDCGGTKYVPLMAAGQWLGADVAYDGAAKTVTITHNGKEPVYHTWSELVDKGVISSRWEGLEDRSKSQQAQLLRGVTFTVDGKPQSFTNAQGKTVYPLLFRGYPFIPVEVVGQLENKQMLEFPDGFANYLYLYNAPTQAEYSGAKAYLAAVRERLDAVRATVKGAAPKSEEEYTAKVRQMQEHLKAVWTLPEPSFKCMKPFVERIRYQAQLVLWQHIDSRLPAEENSGARPSEDTGPVRPVSWIQVKNSDGETAYVPGPPLEKVKLDPKDWGEFAQSMITEEPDVTTYFLELEVACTNSETFLSKVTPLSADPAAFTDAAEGQTVHVSMRPVTRIVINGAVDAGLLCGPGKRCEPIPYNGTVYIPLMTVGLWLGANVAYDQNAGAVFIVSNGTEPVYYSGSDFNHMDVEWQQGAEQFRKDRKNGIYVQLLPDVTVTVNGQTVSLVNAVGEPVYPLLFRESVYLPVRSVAGWMGKQVQWVSHGDSGTIHIYDTPTREELDEANAYVAAAQEHVTAVRVLLEGAEVHTEEEFTAHMRAIQAHLKTVMDLPYPIFPSMANQAEAIRYYTMKTLLEKVDGYLPMEEKSGAEEAMAQVYGPGSADPLTWSLPKEFSGLAPEAKWAYIKDIFLTEMEFTNFWFLTLEEQCDSAGAFMAATVPAQPTKE